MDKGCVINFRYRKPELENGYNNRMLKIDLSRMGIYTKLVDERMKKIFTGGKGFDLKLLWDSVKDDTKWDDPENALCIASGPLGGTPIFPGAGKSIVTTLSPLTGIPIDSNVGGYFGPFLKFSGFDALEITGKSQKDVIIFIDGIRNEVSIFDALDIISDKITLSHEISPILTKYFGKDRPQDISVVSTGPGAKHNLMGCLNFTLYDRKRKIVKSKQAGRGGTGTVFANKGIKAIVCRWDSVKMDTNNPADLDALKKIVKEYSEEIHRLDPDQMRMSVVGTTHLTSIMGADELQLLPVKNFQYGTHPEVDNLSAEVFEEMFDKGSDGCWKGCAVACSHGIKNFELKTGPLKGQKVWVDGPEYETIAALGSNLGIFDPYFVAEMNFYCDTYGLDTISVGVSITFVMECFERKLIAGANSDLWFGNKEAVARTLHEMGQGENHGLSRIIGQGVKKTKEFFKQWTDDEILDDIGMVSKGLEFSLYITKESLAQQGGYGFALKGAQHDEAWLIFEDMVRDNMPTFEQKAEALFWFPMWRTWFGLCGLCKLPWNDIIPEGNEDTEEPAKVMEHVQRYVAFYNAVTGENITSDGLILMSEKVYNFQRLFNLRMGFGTSEHDNIPYRAMGPVTVEEYESRRERYDKQFLEKYKINVDGWSTNDKIQILRIAKQDEYHDLKKAVYKRRGWTKDGIPTLATVRRLGIDFPDVLKLLKKHGVKY